MKHEEYAKHYNPLKEIEVDGEVGGFEGDFLVGLMFMAIIVLVIVL